MMRGIKPICLGLAFGALAFGPGACATQQGLPDAQLPNYEPGNTVEPLKPEPIRPAPITDDKDDELLGGPE